MKNLWVVQLLKDIEEKKFHGKIILNCHEGDVNNIEKRQWINKPGNSVHVGKA